MLAIAVTSGLAEPLLFGDGTPEQIVAALTPTSTARWTRAPRDRVRVRARRAAGCRGRRCRDLGLQACAAVVDRTGVQGRQPEAAALVEAQRVDVVVGGDQPHAGAAGVACDAPHRIDERGPGAAEPPLGVQRQDLARRPVDHVRQDAGEPSVVRGQQRRVCERVLEHPRRATLARCVPSGTPRPRPILRLGCAAPAWADSRASRSREYSHHGRAGAPLA